MHTNHFGLAHGLCSLVYNLCEQRSSCQPQKVKDFPDFIPYVYIVTMVNIDP